MRRDVYIQEAEVITLLEADDWKFVERILHKMLAFKKDNQYKIVLVKTNDRVLITATQRKILRLFFDVGVNGYAWSSGENLILIEHNIDTSQSPAQKTEDEINKAIQSRVSKELIHLFATKWFDKYNVPMNIKYYYYKNIFNLLSTYQKDDIISGMDAYFDTVDKFITGSQHSLGLFLSSVDRYIVISKQPKPGRGRTA